MASKALSFLEDDENQKTGAALDFLESDEKPSKAIDFLNEPDEKKSEDKPGILDYAKSLIRQPLPGPAGLIENILNPNQPKIPLSVDSVKRGIDTAKDAVNSTYEALASGSAQGAAALARTPNLIYNVAAFPINQALKASGYQEIKDPAIFEDSAKWWDSLSNETDVKSKKWAEQGQDINTFVRDGNYKEAGKWLAYQTIKNLPQQVMFVGSAMAGVPAAGLALAGTSSAAQELAEGRERGASPTSSVLNATMNGMIEASFENLGTFGLFKETAKTFGKASTNVFKETIKTLFKEPLGEGAEEFATSLAQDFSRYVNGIDPNAMKGSVGRALAAGSIGTASGAAVTTPAAIRMGLNQRGKINDFSTENDVPRGTIIDGKTMGPKTENYLSKQYPQLYEGILNKEIPLEPDQVNDLLFKSAAAGEEVLLKGGTPEQANQAATEAFVREATPLVNQVEEQRAIDRKPQPIYGLTPDIAALQEGRFVESEASKTQPLPQVGSPQPFDLENDAIEPAQVDDSVISFPEPSKNIRIPKKQIMAEAQNLYDRAIEDREGSVSALERFVKDNGGIAPYSINPTTGQKEEREEYRSIPVRLRGTVPYDEMMQMAVDNNILPPDSSYGDLYEQLGSIKKRGDLPRLEDFYDEARRNIEYEKLQARVNKGEKLPPDIAANYSAMRRNDLRIKAKEAAQKVLSANKIDDRVVVNIVDQIAVDPVAFKEGYGTEYKQDTFDILGATYPAQAKSRIQAVIELAQGATESTGRHEAFHAVSNILLEENEQSIITKKYGDMEKAADAFGEYRATKASTGDSVIDRVFQRITEFLEKFSNYLTENNFTTANELFQKIEGGKFADRAGNKLNGKDTTQYSVIQLDMYDGKKARVVKNPTPEQARNLSLQSPYGSLRYLQSPDGHLYVWDAEKLTHNDVMNELGVEATPQNLEKTGTVGNEVEAAQIAKQFSDGAASPKLKGTTQYSAAYHGSPHVFDKFSLQKIGTGEGAQAYGYGLYFSGKKEVAEYYKDKLSGTKFVENSTGKVFDSREIPSNKLNRLATEFKQFKGRLYKVDIPDDAEYLDWDKPLSKQPEKVKKALKRIESEVSALKDPSVPGAMVYRQIAEHVRVVDEKYRSNSEEGASRWLAELGIPGIKFKDQGSRFNLYVGNNKDNTAFEVRTEKNDVVKTFENLDDANDYVANQGTSNYVVFDDNLVKITDVQYSAKVKPGDSGYIPKGVYAENRAMGKSESILSDLKETGRMIKETLDKTLTPISTRLYNIDPSLKKALRRHEYNLAQQITKDLKVADTFFKKINKVMSKDDLIDFDLARKNGDAEMLQRMIIKYGIGKEYYALRKMLNDSYARAKEVNFDLGYREHYHPRSLKDKRGFLEYLQKGEDWSIMQEAIAEKEKTLNRIMTMEEKADFLNTMIRGYGRGKISLSETGQMKARRINFVDAAMNRFFYKSDASLIQYINQVNNAIEARRFFGKHAAITDGNDFGVSNKQIDLNNSIGAYAIELLAKDKITPIQEKELTDILHARFAPSQMGPLLSLYRDVSYLDTMGSPISAITQLGDLGLAAYRSNPFNAFKNLSKAILNKSDINMKDLGVDKIAEEFNDPKKLQKLVNKVFKMTGLEKMDRLGKETYVNSVIDDLRRRAKNPNADFVNRLNRVFEEDTSQVINDLKSGAMSDDIRYLAFNELLDLQPIAKSETPEKYLSSGNGRIFYMLKSFQLKQLDMFRKEIALDFANKSPGGKIAGITKLLYMGALIMAANAGADFLKNIILNRPTYVPDMVADNLFRLALISKYTVYSARQEGAGTALLKTIAPPAKLLTSFYKDFINYNPDKDGMNRFQGNLWKGKPLETTQSIPVVGKIYYWWMGGGVDKTKNTKKRMAKAARKNK